MKPMLVVRKPVGIKHRGKCGGLVGRITLSRLEEGFGHEGYECQKCKQRIKYVRPDDAVATR